MKAKSKPKPKSKSWNIRHFDDYHEIEPQKPKEKAIELGCFPPKRGYGYFRYFGLFYQGRKPSQKVVLEQLKKMVHLGKFVHQNTGEEVGLQYEELKESVSESFAG